MLDLTTLLSPKYWFDLTPSPMSGLTDKILLVFFLIIFLAGIFFRLTKQVKKFDRFKLRAWRRLSGCSLTMGGLGLILLFFSYEQIRLFGSRFWYVFWVIGLIIWLVLIWHDYFKVASRERYLEEQRRNREKYLPRRK